MATNTCPTKAINASPFWTGTGLMYTAERTRSCSMTDDHPPHGTVTCSLPNASHGMETRSDQRSECLDFAILTMWKQGTEKNNTHWTRTRLVMEPFFLAYSARVRVPNCHIVLKCLPRLDSLDETNTRALDSDLLGNLSPARLSETLRDIPTIRLTQALMWRLTALAVFLAGYVQGHAEPPFSATNIFASLGGLEGRSYQGDGAEALAGLFKARAPDEADGRQNTENERSGPIQDDAVGIKITSPSNDEVLAFRDMVLTFETRGFAATVNTPIEVSLPQNVDIPFILMETADITLSSPRPCTHLVTLSATVQGQHVSSSVLYSTIPDKDAILSARVPLPADAVWGPRSESAPSRLRKPEVSPIAHHHSNNTSEQGPFDVKGRDVRVESPQPSKIAMDTEKARPISLVFVGTLDLDGQKHIWLEQMERLSRARFTPTYLTFDAMYNDIEEADASSNKWQENAAHTFVRRLRHAGVQLIAAHLPTVDLSQVAHGIDVQSDIHSIRERLNQMALDSYDRAAGDPRLMSPSWTRDIFHQIADAVKYASPDIMVIANGQTLADVVLTRATRWAMGTGGGKIVMDCPNLGPTPGVDVDALTTPSHYVSRHPETQAAAAAAGAPVVVIPPGVRDAPSDDFAMQPTDTGGILSPSVSGESISDMAHADSILERMDHCHPACHIVGFAGRLAPEKSPGLFMVVAQALAELIPSAIFVVVGDGPLKLDLEATAARLGIASRVHFAGWANGAHLERLLKGMTLLFNPSLAESETFCIINIQAMSLGTPVAAFGIGGMLEYGNFELLDDAEPRVVATALAELLLDRPRLDALAERGKAEVKLNFQADVALNRWTLLYETLVGRGTATF